MLRSNLLIRALITLLFAAVCSYGEEIAVIVAKDASIDALSKREAARIFLAKTNRLPDGRRATTVEPSDLEAKKLFYHEVAGKSEVQLRSYWAKLLFTGRGRPPRQEDDAAKILAFVNENPGAIAYLPARQLDGSVKVLLRVP